MSTLNDILKESLKEKKAYKDLSATPSTPTTKQQEEMIQKYTGVSSAAAKNLVNNYNNVSSTPKTTENKSIFTKANDFLTKYLTTQGVESLDDSSKFKKFSQKADKKNSGTSLISMNTNNAGGTSVQVKEDATKANNATSTEKLLNGEKSNKIWNNGILNYDVGYKLSDKDLEKINNYGGVYVDKNTNKQIDNNYIEGLYNNVNTQRNDINKKIESLNLSYKLGKVSDDDYKSKYDYLKEMWDKSEDSIKELDNYELRQGKEYYDWLKENGSDEEIQKFEAFVGSFDDSRTESLINSYKAAKADQINTVFNTYSMVRSYFDKDYSLTDPNTNSQKLSDYSNEMRSYTLNGANDTGIRKWTLQSIEGVMPTIVNTVDSLVLLGAFGVAGETASNVVKATNSIAFGLNGAAETTRQRIAEGNQYETSFWNGVGHGFVTGATEYIENVLGFGATSSIVKAFTGSGASLLGMGLLSLPNGFKVALERVKAGAGESFEEIAEVYGDWLVDNFQNGLYVLSGNDDYVKVTDTTWGGLNEGGLTDQVIIAFMGAVMLDSAMNIPTTISTLSQYNATQEGKKLIKELQEANIKSGDFESAETMGRVYDLMSKESKTYLDKHPNAKAIQKESDISKPAPTVEDVMNITANAFKLDVSDTVQQAEANKQRVVDLYNQLEQGLVDRGLKSVDANGNIRNDINLDEYLELTPEARSNLNTLGQSEFINKAKESGVQVFYTTANKVEVQTNNGTQAIDMVDKNGNIINNGFNKSGNLIVINPNVASVESIARHEVFHSLAKENQTKLANTLKKIIGEDAWNEVNAIVSKNYDKDVVAEETNANVIQYLFESKEALNKLYGENQNIFRKLYNNVSYYVKKGLFDSKYMEMLNDVVVDNNKLAMSKDMEDVSNDFETNNENPALSNDIRYSKKLTSNAKEDSEGNKLEDEQVKYFTGTQLTDGNGNLMPIYHTSPNLFTVFDPTESDNYRFGDNVVNYYSNNKDVSGSYTKGKYKDFTNDKLEVSEEYKKAQQEETRLRNEKTDLLQYVLKDDIKLFENAIDLEKAFTKLYREEKVDFFAWNKFYRSECDYLESLSATQMVRLGGAMAEAAQEMIGFLDADSKEYEQAKQLIDYASANEAKYDEIDNALRDAIKKSAELSYQTTNIQYKGYGLAKNPYILNGSTELKGEELIQSALIKLTKGVGAEKAWDNFEYANWNTLNKSDYRLDENEMYKVFKGIEKYILENYSNDEVSDRIKLKKTSKQRLGKELLESMDEEQANYLVNNPIALANIVNEIKEMQNGTLEVLADEINDGKFDISLTTNDVVKAIIAINNYIEQDVTGEYHYYDGVIFKNITDSGSYDEKANIPSDIIALFDSNQFKDINNKKPTDNEDIRFSKASPSDYAVKINKHLQKLSNVELKKSSEVRNVLESIAKTGEIGVDEYNNFVNKLQDTFSWEIEGEDINEDIKSYIKNNHYKVNMTSLGINADKFTKNKDRSSKGWGEVGGAKEMQSLRNKFKGIIEFVDNTNLAEYSKRLGNNGKLAGGSKGMNTKGDGIDVVYNEIRETFGDMLPDTTDPMEMLDNIYEVMTAEVKPQIQYDEQAYNQHKELYDAFFEDFKENYNKEIIEESTGLDEGTLDGMLNQKISPRQEAQIENAKQVLLDNVPKWVKGYETIKAEFPNFAESTLKSAVFEVLAYGDLTPETYNAMVNTLSSEYEYEGIDASEKDAINRFINETMATFVNEAKYKAGETDRELVKRAIKQNNATGMKDVEGAYTEGLEGRTLDKRSAELKAKIQQDYQPIVESLITLDQQTRETKGKKADAKVSYWKTMDQNISELANGNKELYDTLKQKIRYECLDNGAKSKTNVLKQAQNVIDKIKELGIREGTKEDIGLQYYLEQHTEKQRDDVSLETSVELPDGTKAIDKDAIEELKRNPYEKYTIDNLKKDFNYTMDNGKLAWENIVEASRLLRDSYDETIDKLNRTQIDANGDVEGKEDAETWKLLVEVENAFTTMQSIKDEIKRNGSKESTQAAFEIAKANYNKLARQYNERINKDEKGDLTRRNLTPYRENYSHHIQRNNLVNTIKNIKNAELAVPTELAGLSDFTNPNTAWASFSAAQEGGKYVPTGLGSYASYMTEAANVIAYNPIIVELRQFNKDIKNTAQGTTLNTLSEYLNDYCNMLAGKRNPLDRTVQKYIGAKPMKVIQALNSYAKGAALAGNIRSGLVQFANIPNGLSILEAEGGKDYVQDVAKGITSYIKAISSEGITPMEQSPFLSNRFFDFDTGEKSFTKSLKDASSFVLTIGDKVGAETIWWCAYEQCNRLGLDVDPIQYADDITRRAIAGRTKEDMAITMNSQVLNLLMPFQVENNNLYQTLKQEVKGKKFGAVMTYMVTAYLFNMIIKGITNGDDEVLPEFITPIVEEMKKALTEGQDADTTAQNILLGEIGEFLMANPAGNQITEFIFGDDAETVFGGFNPNRYGTSNIGASGIKNAIVDIVKDPNSNRTYEKLIDDLVGGYVKGGKQLTRTVGGLKSMGALPKINGDDEIEVSPINYTKSGKVAYVNDQSNISDWIRASLFGKGSTSEAKKYYANNDYLTDKEKRIFDTLQSDNKNAYENYQQAKDYKGETNLRDQLIEQGKYGSYKDQVTQAYANYLDEWYKTEHDEGDTPKSWNQFANTYGITSKDLMLDTYGDFYEKYDIGEDNQKVLVDALEIENTVNSLGKTIANSAATQRRIAYEEAGIYENILEYIEENNLEYSDFGLTKTVVGYNKYQINNMLQRIGKEANYEGSDNASTGTNASSGSSSSKTSSKSSSTSTKKTTQEKLAEEQRKKFLKAAKAYMKAVNGNTNDVFSVLKNMTTMKDAKSNVDKIMKNAYKGK